MYFVHTYHIFNFYTPIITISQIFLNTLKQQEQNSCDRRVCTTDFPSIYEKKIWKNKK